MTPTVGWQLQIRWWKQKATMMKQNDFNETNDYDKTIKWMTMVFKLVLKKYHKIDIWLQHNRLHYFKTQYCFSTKQLP